MISERKQIYVNHLFRSLIDTKIDEIEQSHLSEPTPPSNSSTRTTPTPSENMTQQVLRLAEKINDQYLTCKICLV
jgi:hypothetical protein